MRNAQKHLPARQFYRLLKEKLGALRTGFHLFFTYSDKEQKKGGNGYGATFHHPLPYRIDHIFYNEGLKLKSIRKVDSQGLSDHDALVAEFWVEQN